MDAVTHAYGKAGVYQVTLTIDDNLGGVVSDSFTVTILNVPPTVVIWAIPPTADEGEDVTFDGYFDDPSWLDEHTATWDFGDGSPTEPGTFYPGVGYTHHEMDEVTHAYGKAGVYEVTLTIDDNLGGITSDSVTVTIVNVPPTVVIWAVPPTADEAEDITFDGYFDDPSWLDEHTAEWDFGDGSPTEPGTFSPGVGYTHHEMDEVTHAYGKAGVYQVTLTVDDNLGGVVSASVNVTIVNVPPTVVIWAVPPTADEAEDITFDGYFDDPSWLDEHTATWDFGDGTPTVTGTFYPGVGYTHHEMDEVIHAYGKAGVYQVTLTIDDNLGGVVSDSVTVTILNVAPTVNASISTTLVQEGSYFTVRGSFYDPSWNDTFDEVYFDFGYEDTMRGLGPIQDRDYWPPPGPGNVTHIVDPMDWIYGDDGNYTIYLNVTDEFGGFDSDSMYIVVENVAPTVLNVTVILHQNAPRTHGYWKHQCKIKNPKPNHPGIRQEWIDAIRQQSAVFTDVYTKDDVCDYLDPPNPMTPMKRAKMQLMALWLNVVSGLLFYESPLHHPNAPGINSVAEFIAYAEYLILYDPTDPNLNWVATIATDIVEDASGGNDWEYIDPVVGEHFARGYDPGTDDLMFVWEDGLPDTGNIVHYHYNDGIGPEPPYSPISNQVKTPWGTYPFDVIDRLIVGYPPNSASGTTGELLCLKDDDDGESVSANKDCSDSWANGMSPRMMLLGEDEPVDLPFDFMTASRIAEELLRLKDDDDGVPVPANEYCSYSWACGVSPTMMLLGADESVDWSFEFTIDYVEISDGFIIAEVQAAFTNTHPLVDVLILGGWIEEG
jgi:PKD repeat protein